MPALKKISNPENASVLIALQKKKAVIDQYVFKHQKGIILLASVKGKTKLVAVKKDNWSDNTVYMYNIIKDTSGRIIMIAQVPYSESGDWYVEYKHYFDSDGNTFAFSKRGTVFDDSVKGGVAVEELLNYYNNGVILSQINRLTDKDDKVINKKRGEFDFREFKYSIYKGLKDCLAACNIQI